MYRACFLGSFLRRWFVFGLTCLRLRLALGSTILMHARFTNGLLYSGHIPDCCLSPFPKGPWHSETFSTGLGRLRYFIFRIQWPGNQQSQAAGGQVSSSLGKELEVCKCKIGLYGKLAWSPWLYGRWLPSPGTCHTGHRSSSKAVTNSRPSWLSIHRVMLVSFHDWRQWVPKPNTAQAEYWRTL